MTWKVSDNEHSQLSGQLKTHHDFLPWLCSSQLETGFVVLHIYLWQFIPFQVDCAPSNRLWSIYRVLYLTKIMRQPREQRTKLAPKKRLFLRPVEIDQLDRIVALNCTTTLSFNYSIFQDISPSFTPSDITPSYITPSNQADTILE